MDLGAIKSFLVLLAQTRQVGKTTAAIELTKMVDGAVLICHNQKQAKEISQKHGIQTCSTESLNTMAFLGSNRKVIIDQDAAGSIIYYTLNEIDRLKNENRERIEELADLRREVQDLYYSESKQALGMTHPSQYVRRLFNNDNS